MKKNKTIMALIMACLVMFTAMSGLASSESVTATGMDATVAALENDLADNETTAATAGYQQGDSNHIGIMDVTTHAAFAGSEAGIEFRTILGTGEIISVRPKADASGPFVLDENMYVIKEPDNANNKLTDEEITKNQGYITTNSFYTIFKFNTKGDVKTGYYAIPFEIEYTIGGVAYRLEKSIDISIYNPEDETTTASDEAVSVPRIIVTGFETNPEKVMAGEEFELTVHLQNTSNQTAVTNIKVTMSTANNEFLPASGSSNEFVRSIGCGQTKDIVIKMKAQGSLEQKPYVLTVDCDYEGEKNAPYKATESISIPVYQEAKAKITDVEVMPESLEVFGQANVMFSINNTGKSTLYNVQVAVDKNNQYVQSDDSFVGNIQPGSTGYADFMVNGVAPTMDDGKVKIIISYEDANGEVGTFEQDITLFVFEPYVEDPGMIGGMDGNMGFEDPGMMEEPQGGGIPGTLIAAIIAVVVIAIIVTVVVIKKKKQKALEEELEDEIS